MSAAPRSEESHAPDDVRPEPLTPPEADLQDFPFMPLHVARLRDSDLAAEGDPEACWYAVLLWAASWHQLPAGSLPDNDAVLTRLIGLGRDTTTFARHRDQALRGFVTCSDGRLYHPVVAEQVNSAWESKVRFQDRKAERQEIARKAAAARWTRDADASVMPDAQAGDASAMHDARPGDAQAMHDARPSDASSMADAMPKGRGTGTGRTEEEADASPSGAPARSRGRGAQGRKGSEGDGLETRWREISALYADHGVKGRGSPMAARSAWLRLDDEDRRLLPAALKAYLLARPWGSNGPPALARIIAEGMWREFVSTASVTDIVWRGPADLRAAVVAEMGDGFARSYLDPSEWRDPGSGRPAVIVPLNVVAASKLRATTALKALAIQDPILPRKSA